jgi:hypothetical protein
LIQSNFDSESRSESLERLNKLVASGQASEDELHSLTKNVESLRLGKNVSCISPEALDQIRSLLSLTDEAIFSVRRNRVLDGLRFDQMYERFEDIEEAHKKTFDWILEARRPSMDGEDGDSQYEEDSQSNSDDEDEHSKSSSSEENEGDEEDVKDEDKSAPVSLSSRKSSNASQDSCPAESRLHLDERSDDITRTLTPGVSTESDEDSTFNWNSNNSLKEIDLISITSEGELSNSSRSSDWDPPRSPNRLASPLRMLDIPQPLWEVMAEARDHFIAWLEQGDGIFHISGKPGSGKSTLMKFICKHSKTKDHLQVWAGDEKLVLGKFFFWKPGSALQKSVKGLVRGLLHCLLSNSPDLIPLVLPVQWEASLYREKIHIENQECQKGFETLISAKAVYKEHRFALFIDGLDEFEGNHAGLIRKLFEWTNHTQSVKICVSSREWTVFQKGFQKCPKLRLHELTRSDIQRFVGDRFQEMDLGALKKEHQDSDLCDAIVLQREVIRMSDGVFLWVSLILRHIEDGLVNGDQMEDLMNVVNALPTELEPMLQQILSSIPPANRKLAYGILSLALFCNRYNYDCRLMQYSFMEEYTRDKNSAMNSPVRLFTETENNQRLERAKKRIYGVCKGFLELRPFFSGTRLRLLEIYSLLGDVVRFTHRSIVEYLESQHFREKLELELPDFDHFDAYCQTYLSQIKHVHLPRFYYAPGRRSQNRFLTLNNGMILHHTPEPSLMSDSYSIIISYLRMGKQGYKLRFFGCMDAISQAMLDLNLNTTNTYLNMGDNIPYVPPQLITLLSAALGLSEYISHRRGIGSALISKCISLRLGIIMFWMLVSTVRYRAAESQLAMKRSFQVLEVLFSQGGSPDSEFWRPESRKSPSFHVSLSGWCHGHGRISLALIAFMLYHGANPRFAMVFSKKRYRIEKRSEETVETGFKTCFKTEQPPLGSSGQLVDAAQIVRRLKFPAFYGESCIAASPRTLDILTKHGRTLHLRALVSIWFPRQGVILQQVIDWILKLVAPVEEDHRSQLKSKFGHLLRPLFDDESPDFIGWDPVVNVWPGEDVRALQTMPAITL